MPEKNISLPNEGREINPVLSNLLRLDISWASARIWLGPAWAVICGSIASPEWKFTGGALLAMLLSLFLADGILGSLWHQVSILASELEEGEGKKGVKKSRIARPPYLRPGSWGYRLWGWMGAKWSSWQAAGNPTPRIREGILITSFMALVLGALLATAVLILVVLSILVAWWWDSQGEKEVWLSATYSGGLPWLVGYMSISPLSGNVLEVKQLATLAGPTFWAVVYLLAIFAFKKIAGEHPRRGFPTLILAQLAGMLVLILAKQPILAGVSGLLLLPQMLFLGRLPRQKQGGWYLQRIQVFTMTSMLVGAIALHGS
ncbi:MAG: hypothetical protein HYX86_04400 [Chloroflexi bacterium]|nr:hypothetical protein [Chloroflexota bacterium]